MFPPEPTIRVGSYTLSTPEAMTVRVAHEGHRLGDVTTIEAAQDCYNVLEAFNTRLKDEGLGDDEIGRSICQGYIHHASTVMGRLTATFGPLGDPHV